MRVFITGVAGFLGSHIADAMLADGHNVRGIDNLLGGEFDNIPEGVSFQEADCNERKFLVEFMEGADVVVHCAATAYEGLSVFSPHTITENIVGASVGVFSAAISCGVKRIVHCSSMARYGALAPPFVEEMDCRPQDPYGIGKLCAEQMLRNLCETHHVEYVIAVPHNIIGPRQKYDDPYRNVASIMINRMLQGRPPIIYGDGQQRRCFSYIDDVIGCLKALVYQDNVVGHVINIGPDEEPVTIDELAYTIRDIIRGPRVLLPQYMPGRPQEVKVALCSSEKARGMLGYRTKTTLREGLEQMVEFIRTRGLREFKYHLPLEIVSDKTPKTWTERLF